MSGPFVNPDETFEIEIDGVTFRYSAMTGRQAAKLGQLASADRMDEAADYCLTECLKGWAGNGAPPFPDDVSDAIAMLNPEAYNGINQAIMARTGLSEEERGN